MGFKYGLGVVNGTGALPDNNKFKDVYLTLSQTIGAGDGQNAGQRIGAFVCYGKRPTSLSDSLSIPSPTGEVAGCDNKAYYRYGGAVSLNWMTFNLAALYMRGVDNDSYELIEETKDYEYGGGFVELDYAGLWNNRLVASALYNWVEPPSEDTGAAEIAAYSGLIRYYIGDWSAVNVALHAEYTHRILEATDNTATEDIYSMLVDFAF